MLAGCWTAHCLLLGRRKDMWVYFLSMIGINKIASLGIDFEFNHGFEGS